MVAAAGALIGVAGFARQDCSDQLPACKDFGEAVEASGSYWVHQYASLLAFLLLLVSFFVLARGLRRTGHSRLAVISRTVGVACSTGVALLVVAPPFVVDNYGILQRVVIGALFGWPVVAGILASRPVPAPSTSAAHQPSVGSGSTVESSAGAAVRPSSARPGRPAGNRRPSRRHRAAPPPAVAGSLVVARRSSRPAWRSTRPSPRSRTAPWRASRAHRCPGSRRRSAGRVGRSGQPRASTPADQEARSAPGRRRTRGQAQRLPRRHGPLRLVHLHVSTWPAHRVRRAPRRRPPGAAAGRRSTKVPPRRHGPLRRSHPDGSVVQLFPAPRRGAPPGPRRI